MSRRYLVLGFGLVLFFTAFSLFFVVENSRIEQRLKTARADQVIELTAAIPTNTAPVVAVAPTSAPAVIPTPAAPETTPAASSSSSSSSAPGDINTNFNISLPPMHTGGSVTPRGDIPAYRTALLWRRAFAAGLTAQLTSDLAPPMSSPTMPPAPATNKMVPTSPSSNSAPLSPTPAPNSETNNAPVSGIPGTSALRPVSLESSVIVLGYHQFIPAGTSSKFPTVMPIDMFESEMKYLKDNGYNVIPLADVVRFAKHEIGLPPRSVAITIDDGYKSVITYAVPVLKKYNFPWTFFCYTDYIDSGGKSVSWKDLLDLQAAGVDIESHSKSHQFMAHRHGLDPDKYDKWLTDETALPKTILEQHLNKKVPFFAYPYGDYNKEAEAHVLAAGYEAIFTVASNPVHSTTPLTSLGRYFITPPENKLFASYLHQAALSVSDPQPAPGSTVSEPRPNISAGLSYYGTLDPKSIAAEVHDFGRVHSDFDPKTSVVRIYLPRDLVDHTVTVTIHAKDAESQQTLVALWHFNYEPPGSQPSPMMPPGPNSGPAPSSIPVTTPTASPLDTNTPPVRVLKSIPSSPTKV